GEVDGAGVARGDVVELVERGHGEVEGHAGGGTGGGADHEMIGDSGDGDRGRASNGAGHRVGGGHRLAAARHEGHAIGEGVYATVGGEERVVRRDGPARACVRLGEVDRAHVAGGGIVEGVEGGHGNGERGARGGAGRGGDLKMRRGGR